MMTMSDNNPESSVPADILPSTCPYCKALYTEEHICKEAKLNKEAELKVARMVEYELSCRLREQNQCQEKAEEEVRAIKSRIAQLEYDLEYAKNKALQAKGLKLVYLQARQDAYTELRRLIDGEGEPNE